MSFFRHKTATLPKPLVIYTRDGKELPVDLTLRMAQEIIEVTARNHVERGLAMSLEAALLALIEKTP